MIRLIYNLLFPFALLCFLLWRGAADPKKA